MKDQFIHPNEVVRQAALELAEARRKRDEEYLRLVATGETTYHASRMADLEFGATVLLSEAEYEIALQHMRRS